MTTFDSDHKQDIGTGTADDTPDEITRLFDGNVKPTANVDPFAPEGSDDHDLLIAPADVYMSPAQARALGESPVAETTTVTPPVPPVDCTAPAPEFHDYRHERHTDR